MCIIAGPLTINPAVVTDLQKDLATLAPRVRGEAGCLHCSLLVEDAKTGLVNVLERWTDDQALALHLKQPWILEFLGKYGAQFRAMDVKLYDISGTRELPAM